MDIHITEFARMGINPVTWQTCRLTPIPDDQKIYRMSSELLRQKILVSAFLLLARVYGLSAILFNKHFSAQVLPKLKGDRYKPSNPGVTI